MTLRRRLVFGAAAAVALAVAFASLVVYVVVRHDLRGQVDDALRGLAPRVSIADRRVGGEVGGVRTIAPAPGPFSGEAPRQLRVFVPGAPLGGPTGFAQVVAASGQVLSAFPDGKARLPVDAATRAVAAGSHGAFFADKHVAGVHVRVYTTRGLAGEALLLARPLTETDSTLSRLRWILLAISLGGIAAAAGLGQAVARGALAPVVRLTEASEHVAETQDLSHRIPPGSGDELDRLGASFNTMLGALDASRQAQRQLVADASHELRTPLTSIRTNIELLAGAPQLDPAERQRALTSAREQLEELTVLVGDLVDLARDGAAEAEMEDVRLDLLTTESVERAQKLAPGVVFDTQVTPSLVRGSPARLQRAVGNLLDNACKWSPPGGRVEVRVAAGEISVRDHGPGIAAADLPRVFERFFRAPDARGLPGSGLGLAIVRDVAEAHGGSVHAEHAQGGGACLRLRLPEVLANS